MKVQGGSQVLQQKKDANVSDQEYDSYYSSDEYYDDEEGSYSQTYTETNQLVDSNQRESQVY